VERLKLNYLVEYVPQQATDGKVLLEVVTHVVALLVLEDLLDVPIKVFVVESDELLNILVLTDHRLDSLTEALIIKHEGKDAEAKNLRLLDDLCIHGIHTHEKTEQEILGMEPILDELLQLSVDQGFGLTEARRGQLVIHLVEILIL
jgi:hypothetical protein